MIANLEHRLWLQIIVPEAGEPDPREAIGCRARPGDPLIAGPGDVKRPRDPGSILRRSPPTPTDRAARRGASIDRAWPVRAVIRPPRSRQAPRRVRLASDAIRHQSCGSSRLLRKSRTKIRSGKEHSLGATHCEWAVLVDLMGIGGPVTGPPARSPRSGLERCATIFVVPCQLRRAQTRSAHTSAARSRSPTRAARSRASSTGDSAAATDERRRGSSQIARAMSQETAPAAL